MAQNLSTAFMIAPATDKQYMEAMDKLRTDLKMNLIEAKFNEGWIISPSELTTNQDLLDVIASEARVFSSFSFRFISNSGPTLVINRNPKESGVITFFDKISINGGDAPTGLQARLIAHAQKLFGTMAVDYVGEMLGPEAKRHFEAREVAVTRLEVLSANLLNEMEDARKRAEADLQKKSDALDSALVSKTERLEAQYQQRSKEQDARDTAMDLRQSQLDDASAKDQRRKDFQKLKDTFSGYAKQFTVTQGTLDQRRLVYRLLYFAVYAFLSMAVGLTCLLLLPTFTDNLYWQMSRSAAWILFVTTTLYFIKWNNAWFDRLANEEFRLKRMALDVDRANWMIETASEWKEDEKELPAELLTRMSVGLFAANQDAEPVEHTADILGKAIAAASQVKIGPGGTELQWGKKGLNK